MKSVWDQYLLQLRQVFSVYCRYDVAANQTWDEMMEADKKISFKELHKFAYDFRVMPGLVSRNQLAAVCRHNARARSVFMRIDLSYSCWWRPHCRTGFPEIC